MASKVRYNGGTQSYYGCPVPTNLIVGKEYEVILSRKRGWRIDYTLKGIEGEFNSIWFDEVAPDAEVYMAFGEKIPEVGKRYSCYIMDIVKDHPKFVAWHISTVKESKYLGNNIYQVITSNGTYIVNVG